MPTQASTEAIDIAELTQAVDDARDVHGTVQLHNGQEILHELSIPRAIAQAGGDIRAASHAE